MIYLDASALVKLIVAEDETSALRRYLRSRRERVTSDLAITEVLRAALRRGSQTVQRAEEVLDRIDKMRITPRILLRAGRLEPPNLRALDALHVATALEISEELEAFVAYDSRILEAAVAAELPIATPGH